MLVEGCLSLSLWMTFSTLLFDVSDDGIGAGHVQSARQAQRAEFDRDRRTRGRDSRRRHARRCARVDPDRCWPEGVRGGRRHRRAFGDSTASAGSSSPSTDRASSASSSSSASRRLPPSTALRSAAVASWRWRATSGSQHRQREFGATGSEARPDRRVRRHGSPGAAGRSRPRTRVAAQRQDDRRPMKRSASGWSTALSSRDRWSTKRAR